MDAGKAEIATSTAAGGASNSVLLGIFGALLTFLTVLLGRVFYEGMRVRNQQAEDIGKLKAELEHVHKDLDGLKASFQEQLDDERRRRREAEDNYARVKWAYEDAFRNNGRLINKLREYGEKNLELYTVAELSRIQLERVTEKLEDKTKYGRREEDEKPLHSPEETQWATDMLKEIEGRAKEKEDDL